MSAPANTRRFVLVGMVTTALAAAALAVLAPWAIPVGQLPVTLAVFAVLLAGTTLGVARGTLATLIYLALGLVGLPVFAGFAGGIGSFLIPTGGFLVGYLPLAALSGLSVHIRPVWLRPLPCLAGLIACYAIGIAWFCITAPAPLATALLVAALPYLPLDLVKLAAAVAVSLPCRRALKL